VLFFIRAKRARLARAEGIVLKKIPPKTKSITQVTTQQNLIVSQKNAIGIRRAWFFAQQKPSSSETGVARAEGIALKIIPPKKIHHSSNSSTKTNSLKKNAIGIRRAWFAKGNRAKASPQKPDTKGRAQIIQKTKQ